MKATKPKSNFIQKEVNINVDNEYFVSVLSNTFIENVFYEKDSKVKVSKEFYTRVIKEKDNQLKAL